MPAAPYVWVPDTAVLVPPSPKFQERPVIAALPTVDASLNAQSRYVQLNVNAAVGGVDGGHVFVSASTDSCRHGALRQSSGWTASDFLG